MMTTAADSWQAAWTSFETERKARGVVDVTLAWYAKRLGAFTEWLGRNGHSGITPKTCSPDVVREYQTFRSERGCSDPTINGDMRTLAAFFAFLEAEEHITFNPMRKVRKRKVRPVVKATPSVEDVQKLLDTLRRSSENKLTGARDFAVITLLAETGLRVSELCALRRGDVDWSKNCLVAKGKTGARQVFFTEKSRKPIMVYLRRRPDSPQDSFLFSAKEGRPLTPTHVAHRLRRWCMTGALAVMITPQSLRRFAASELALSGVPPAYAAKQLGHSPAVALQYYVQVNGHDLARMVAQHSPLNRLQERRVLDWQRPSNKPKNEVA